MARAFAAAAALGGCWAGQPPPAGPNEHAAQLAITEASFGPLDARTPATLSTLRHLLPGLDVRTAHDETGLEYNVFLGGEMVLYVVPGDDGEIYNVHATSARISVAGRDWHVGAPFHDTAHLTTCECWGQTLTCWHRGEHIALNFDRECGELPGAEPAAFHVLDGARPARLIWSPKPFGRGLGPLREPADPDGPPDFDAGGSP